MRRCSRGPVALCQRVGRCSGGGSAFRLRSDGRGDAGPIRLRLRRPGRLRAVRLRRAASLLFSTRWLLSRLRRGRRFIDIANRRTGVRARVGRLIDAGGRRSVAARIASALLRVTAGALNRLGAARIGAQGRSPGGLPIGRFRRFRRLPRDVPGAPTEARLLGFKHAIARRRDFLGLATSARPSWGGLLGRRGLACRRGAAALRASRADRGQSVVGRGRIGERG
mmetsp:Transcript_38440/g.98296  ORF Transcript_38440/g.98296 Transcript_38440/m.98296 type:complete len:224 (+) Transcript_38440:555-1226(+)